MDVSIHYTTTMLVGNGIWKINEAYIVGVKQHRGIEVIEKGKVENKGKNTQYIAIAYHAARLTSTMFLIVTYKITPK